MNSTNSKLKVFHIITMLELGGAQQNTLYTISHLNKTQFEAGLITSDKGLLVDEAKSYNISKHFLSDFVRKINPLKDLKVFFQLINILHKEKPDIVHTHSSKAGILGRWAAWFAGVPIIIHSIHGFGFTPLQHPLVHSFFILLEKITKLITTHYIAVSQANIDEGLKLNIISNRDKVSLIRSAIKIETFRDIIVNRAKERAILGIPPDVPLIGTIACLKPQKAPLDFIKIAHKIIKEIPSAKFILIGDGILRPAIEDLIKELNLSSNVILTGWRNDIPKLLKLLDISVLTSLWEGLPRVALQSLAAGVPMVATAVDGTPEVIRDGISGYTAEPHNIDLMATKIIYLLRNPTIYREMQKAGNKILSEEFDIDLMVKQQEELYNSLKSHKS